ncbi:MAG: LLM class flavin-dependent oxidoreductase [Actinomycetota bacterium]
MPVRAGLNLPQYSIDFASGEPDARVVVSAAQAAEDSGFDSVWVSDHPFVIAPDGSPSGALEPTTTMAAVAAATRRVSVGTLVLAASMRAPAEISGIARGLSIVAPARAIVGMGTGWYRPEHDAYGIAMLPYAARLSALEQAAIAAKEAGADLLIGGAGRGVLDIAGRHADRWNCAWDVPVAAFHDLSRTLDAACARAGRQPRSLSRSVGLTVLVGSEADRERAVEKVRRRASFLSSLERGALERSIVAGERGECVERILAYGADEVIVTPFVRDDVEMVGRLGRDVVSACRGAGGAAAGSAGDGATRG